MNPLLVNPAFFQGVVRIIKYAPLLAPWHIKLVAQISWDFQFVFYIACNQILLVWIYLHAFFNLLKFQVFLYLFTLDLAISIFWINRWIFKLNMNILNNSCTQLQSQNFIFAFDSLLNKLNISFSDARIIAKMNAA